MIKKFNDSDLHFYARLQLFIWRCWKEFHGDEERTIDEKLNIMSTWSLELFPKVHFFRIQISDENGLDIPLNRSNEKNHHIVSILAQKARVFEFTNIKFDLRDEPENFEIYNIKWTNSGTQKDKNNTYKKVPKVI
jgi:hypothetical protein